RFGGLLGVTIGFLLDPLAARTALAPLTRLALGLLGLGRAFGLLGHPVGRGGFRLIVLVGAGIDLLVLARLVLGLRGQDDAEIMLGVLEIILRHHIVADRGRVTRKLHVFLSDMGGIAADFDVRAIALVIAREG